MRRRDDWPERLAAHIRAADGRAFAWGSFDCCTFACDAVAAMTDVDPMADLRGRYASAREAILALRDYAGGGLPETAARIAAALDAPEIAPAFAQRGDVVLADVGDMPALGVIGLDGRPVFAGSVGLARLTIRDCSKAWKVG